jgi:hypothetical protein
MDDVLNETQDVSITQDLIREWLKEKHCTLWQSWDIVSQDGINEASAWLLDQIQSVAMYGTKKSS